MTRYVALDTETELIADRRTVATGGPTGTVAVSPYVTPALAVGSLADAARPHGVLYTGPDFCRVVHRLLDDPDNHLVFHTAPFDVDVLAKADPELGRRLLDAADQGRIHDTKILDVLITLARGGFDMPVFDRATGKWSVPEMVSRSLEKVAHDWCGMVLSKDPEIRLSFGQFIGKPLSALSERHQAYAIQDAVATYRAWTNMVSCCEKAGWKHLLSEPIQTRAALVCRELDKRGVAIDRAEAERLRVRFSQDMPALEAALVAAGLGSWQPKKGTIQWVEKYVRLKKGSSPRGGSRRSRGVGCGPELPSVATVASGEGPQGKDSLPVTALPTSSGAATSRSDSMCATDAIVPAASPPTTSSWERVWTTSETPSTKGALLAAPGLSSPVRVYCTTARGVRVAEPQFKLDTKALRALVLELVPDMPKTPSGLVSLDDDLLRERAPLDNPRLAAYLTYSKLRKILDTYLTLYSRVDEVYPRWHALGARSGRMSASRPSVQNVPKRKFGVRSLFVPRPGCVFIVGDYVAQELFTLAEVMHTTMGIDGPLGAALRSGQDPHRFIASHVLKKPADEVTREERQNMKALNFGVPGGLGAPKLARYARGTWGIDWTDAQAYRARTDFLEAMGDVDDYLASLKVSQDAALRHATGRGAKEWRRELGLPDNQWKVIDALLASDNPAIRRAGEDADRVGRVELPTGRVRTLCRFPEAANTYFQGLASDVTKEAAWLAHRAGLRVVLVVHDEIVIEAPDDETVDIEGGWSRQLQHCMLFAFRRVCPTFGPYARVEVNVRESWGPATDGAGKVIE